MRTLRNFALLAALSLLAAAPCRAQRGQPATVVTGTLLGSDGAPMKLAHVQLLSADQRRQLARAQARPDGRYALATVETGLFRLEFTGVDHYSAAIPLYVPGHATLVVNARLKHYEYADSLGKVAAIGDWNHFAFAPSTPLARQPDGRYTATVPVDSTADSVAYELLGLEASGNRSINGTASDRFVYDEGGDYRSVIAAKNGHATIVFDPTLLDRRPAGQFSASFGDPRSPAAQIYALWGDWQEQRGHWEDSAMAMARRHEHGTPHFDWAPFLAGRIAMLPRVREPFLRELVLEQILDARAMGGKIDTALAQRIARDLPPTSVWWAFFEFGGPSRMMVAYRTARGDTANTSDTAAFRLTLGYLDRAIAEDPDSGVQSSALATAVQLARVLHDDRLSNDYFNRLSTGYPNAPELGFLKAMYSPNRVWQVGREVPAFSFRGLDDTTVTYTAAAFAGKVVLLDFWATWCGPCVGEMQYLQAAHDSLAGRGLEMLSISLDNAPQDVTKFRAGEWKMPWLHAFAGGSFNNAELKRLEIMFIPRAILVGRDGKILAVDEELRGDDLLPTLRKALGEHPSP